MADADRPSLPDEAAAATGGPATPAPPNPRLAAQGRERLSPLHRAWYRFVNDPASTRNAILLIVFADIATVLVGGLIIWSVDREEYAELSTAFWYILQTITTVGYGDVTPIEPAGRLIGAAVMLLGIAFLSILTATITSSFIEARQAERRARQDADAAANWAALQLRLDELIERLDRIDVSKGGPGAG